MQRLVTLLCEELSNEQQGTARETSAVHGASLRWHRLTSHIQAEPTPAVVASIARSPDLMR
jgi:hypothetical protein